MDGGGFSREVAAIFLCYFVGELYITVQSSFGVRTCLHLEYAAICLGWVHIRVASYVMQNVLLFERVLLFFVPWQLNHRSRLSFWYVLLCETGVKSQDGSSNANVWGR